MVSSCFAPAATPRGWRSLPPCWYFRLSSPPLRDWIPFTNTPGDVPPRSSSSARASSSARVSRFM